MRGCVAGMVIGLLVWEVFLLSGFFPGCPKGLQRDELQPPSLGFVVKR